MIGMMMKISPLKLHNSHVLLNPSFESGSVDIIFFEATSIERVKIEYNIVF